MRSLRQLWMVTALGIRSLPQRPGSSSVVVIGIACVVAVLLGMLSLSESLAHTINAASRADRVLVISQGALSEGNSAVARDAVPIVAQAPGVRRTAGGDAMVSAEVFLNLPVREKSDGARAMAVIRGVAPIAFAVRPEVKLIAGRMIRPGFNELLVGRNARDRYRGLEVGGSVKYRGIPWAVVVAFASAGNLRESELLTDAQQVFAMRPRGKYQSVLVQLESPDELRAFSDALATNPALAVEVISEPAYAERQSGVFANLLRLIGYLVGAIMAAAATFGAANTLYTAVSARHIEIATLRAIGFGPGAVVLSVIVEALVLALIGAAIGAALVALILNGKTFNSGAASTYLHIDATLVSIGVTWACGIGLLGALFPALRAARMPIAAALREL